MADKDQSIQSTKDENQYMGKERRCHNRIKYNPKECAKLQINSDIFDVLDICENGLRCLNEKEISIDKDVRGTLAFLNRESLDIVGIVEWEKDRGFGLRFKTLISTDMIFKEMRHPQDMTKSTSDINILEDNQI